MIHGISVQRLPYTIRAEGGLRLEDYGLGQGFLASVTGGYTTNKERVAVVTEEYFRPYYKFFTDVWPHLFPLTVASTLISGMLLWQRWGKGADARILWTSALVASAVGVYVTAPFASEQQIGEPFVEWVDRRREQLRAEDPDFAARILGETFALPGIRDFVPAPVVSLLV